MVSLKGVGWLSSGEEFGAPAHLRQAHCDQVQADFRAAQAADAPRRSIRRDPPPRPPELIPSDDPLMLRMAEELDYARRQLDAMGDALAADFLIVKRHGVTLQSFDIIGQVLGHLATVVRSVDRGEAVERIGMGELKTRLKRPPL